jgi:hypothetical protein
MSPDLEIGELTHERTERAVLRNWLTAHGPSLVVWITFLLYSARLSRLISRYAVNVFFADQWEFNDATLFQKHTIWQMFDWQYGPHRQGLGALFARLIEPLFRWNSRIESFIVGGIIVAAALCALWLKRRLYGSVSISDVVIPAIFFTPAQWATVFLTANFAHGPFPLLLTVLYCLAWTCRMSAARYPLVLLINFAAIYTGFGFFLGVVTPLLLVIDYWASAPVTRLPRTYFVVALIVSFVSLGSFFIGYKFNPALDCFSGRPQSLASYVGFVVLMFSTFLSVRSRILGAIILIAMVISLGSALWHLLRPRRLGTSSPEQKKLLITTALITYCLLFCANTAYGRVCAGSLMARSSRYAIYLEPGLLGLYFHVLSIPVSAKRKLLVTGFLVPVLAASVHGDWRGMERFRNVKQKWKACYLQIEDINKCDAAAGFPLLVHEPGRVHLQEKLQYLKRTRQNLYVDIR